MIVDAPAARLDRALERQRSAGVAVAKARQGHDVQAVEIRDGAPAPAEQGADEGLEGDACPRRLAAHELPPGASLAHEIAQRGGGIGRGIGGCRAARELLRRDRHPEPRRARRRAQRRRRGARVRVVDELQREVERVLPERRPGVVQERRGVGKVTGAVQGRVRAHEAVAGERGEPVVRAARRTVRRAGRDRPARRRRSARSAAARVAEPQRESGIDDARHERDDVARRAVVGPPVPRQRRPARVEGVLRGLDDEHVLAAGTAQISARSAGRRRCPRASRAETRPQHDDAEPLGLQRARDRAGVRVRGEQHRVAAGLGVDARADDRTVVEGGQIRQHGRRRRGASVSPS